MEFNAADLTYQERNKLMTGSIAPRPIARVSSISPDGVLNLAPFSYFAPICPEPPLLVFCPNVRSLTGQNKDTLTNIEATGEFVVNIVSQSLVEAMNLSSAELPAEMDEFEFSGVTPIPSKLVRPPRVAESPINLECKLHQIVTIGDQIGQGSLVIGEIVYFHIADDVYLPDHRIDPEKVRPVARLGGMAYARTTDIFDLARPPAQLSKE